MTQVFLPRIEKLTLPLVLVRSTLKDALAKAKFLVG
jgi:hypothetical protein